MTSNAIPQRQSHEGITRKQALTALSKFGLSPFEMRRGCLVFFVLLCDNKLRGPVTMKQVQDRICQVFGKYTKQSNGNRGAIVKVNHYFQRLVTHGHATYTPCGVQGCRVSSPHRFCSVKTDDCKGRELARYIAPVMRRQIFTSPPLINIKLGQLDEQDEEEKLLIESSYQFQPPTIIPLPRAPVVSTLSLEQETDKIFAELFGTPVPPTIDTDSLDDTDSMGSETFTFQTAISDVDSVHDNPFNIDLDLLLAGLV
jgi:hypothetical protein